jgi:hypothetical protein
MVDPSKIRQLILARADGRSQQLHRASSWISVELARFLTSEAARHFVLVQLVVQFHLLSQVFSCCAHKRTVYSVPCFVPPGVARPGHFSLWVLPFAGRGSCSSFCRPVARSARLVFVCAAHSRARFPTRAVRLNLVRWDFSEATATPQPVLGCRSIAFGSRKQGEPTFGASSCRYQGPLHPCLRR